MSKRSNNLKSNSKKGVQISTNVQHVKVQIKKQPSPFNQYQNDINQTKLRPNSAKQTGMKRGIRNIYKKEVR